MKGINLNGSISQWEWYEDSYALHLYLHLAILAKNNKSKSAGYALCSNQVMVTIKDLSRDTGISVKRIRNRLDRLSSTGYISVHATNRFSLITIHSNEYIKL